MSPPPDPASATTVQIEPRRTPIVRLETTPPAPPAPPAPPDPRVWRIYFATDEWLVRADVQPDKREPIAAIVSFLTREAHAEVTRVVCHGFTDNVGTAQYNFELSGKRVNEVGRLLKAGLRGTASGQLPISASPHGEERLPLRPERPDPAERRVEVHVEFKPQ